MGREMHNRKWRALTLVVLGAMLITNERRPAEAKQGVAMMSYFVGLGACLLEITLSGAISIYFEKVLKRTTTPHSVRLFPFSPSQPPSLPHTFSAANPACLASNCLSSIKGYDLLRHPPGGQVFFNLIGRRCPPGLIAMLLHAAYSQRTYCL